MIVPFPARTTLDLAARAVAEGLARRRGHPIAVENRTGADGLLETALFPLFEPLIAVSEQAVPPDKTAATYCLSMPALRMTSDHLRRSASICVLKLSGVDPAIGTPASAALVWMTGSPIAAFIT